MMPDMGGKDFEMARDLRLEAKFAAALGASGTANALDILRREDYGSDAEFIQACVSWELQNTDPRRSELVRKYSRLLNEQREQEAREKAEARRKEIREGMKLTPDESNQVEFDATQATMQAVRDGKIDPRDFNRARAAAVKRLEEKTLDRKTDSVVFNEEIRRMYQETRDFTEEQAQKMSADVLHDLTGK